LVVPRFYIELFWKDPNLQEVNGVEMGGIVFGAKDTAACTNDLNISGTKQAFGTGAVLMRHRSFQRNGNNLHVLLGGSVEAVAAFDGIVIQYPQCSEMHFFLVMPIPEAERMVAIQPPEIYMAPFRGGMEYICHRISICRRVEKTRKQSLVMIHIFISVI
jgi:hypothetical protein